METPKKCRIQDDLYHFVNDPWLAKAVIPDDKPTAGGFSDIDTAVEALLMKDFQAMAKGNKPIPDANVQKAVLLYQKACDSQRRNKEGLAPLLKDLDHEQGLPSISSLNQELEDWILLDWPLPFQLDVETDMKNSARRTLVLYGPDTILPDTSYYQKDNEQGKEFLNIFQAMAKALLERTSLSEEERESTLRDTLLFDQKIAAIVKSSEEWADDLKKYNPWRSADVFQALNPIDLRSFLISFYGRVPDKIIVYDPRFLKNFASLFNEEGFGQFKHWAYLTTLISGSRYCDEATRHLGNAYTRALMGLKDDSSIEKQAFHIADDSFSEPIGLYYGRTYFGEEAKKDVIAMVQDIIAMYKKRISKKTFLAKKTREKAILKLDKMVIKMGYPEKAEEVYDTLTVDPSSSLYEALSILEKENNLYSFKELDKEVDRSRWTMPGDMVNACYESATNDITFPAAILQAPFYSLKQSRSANLGGIGTVIGHEISHAFDNNGALFDENGNIKNWWSKEDRKRFKILTKKMIQQFDGIPFAGSKLNGKLSVSENIADNGGLAVTLALLKEMEHQNYEDFFKTYAASWCEKAREEYLQLLMAVDVHAPAEIRANVPPRNFSEWYRTYHVKKTDGMYLRKDKRLIIW
jgi:putative endopeptidase